MTAPRGAGGVQLGAARARCSARRPRPTRRARCSRQYASLLSTIAASRGRREGDLLAAARRSRRRAADQGPRRRLPPLDRADQGGRRRGAAARSADLRRRRPGAALPRLRRRADRRLPALPRVAAAPRLHLARADRSRHPAPARRVQRRRRPGVEAAAIDLVDLFGVFQSAEANDVVNFSLELLPSVLETKRASGVQTFAVDGYAVDRAARQPRLARCSPSSPTTTTCSSARSSTTSSTTTATRSSARRSGACSTSSSTARRRCAACARCSRAAWR